MAGEALVIDKGGETPQAETSSLAGLFGERYGSMVRLAHLLTGSNGAAEEIVQEAFVALQRRWDQIADPAGYLRTTVVNRCHSWHRRRFLERRHAAVARHEPSYEAEVVELRDALARLSSRQRAAIVLRFYEDLSEAEIATALECRPGTVKSLLSRGLARLGEVIER